MSIGSAMSAGVPGELTGAPAHVVFYYCSDLQAAAEKLAGILKAPCINPRYVEDMKKFKGGKGAVAWLVGHGLSSDSLVGPKVMRKQGIEIDEIIQWCSKNLFDAVVDTCCQPKTRKAIALSRVGSMAYYCKGDDSDVEAITEQSGSGMSCLNDWWDANGMGPA